MCVRLVEWWIHEFVGFLPSIQHLDPPIHPPVIYYLSSCSEVNCAELALRRRHQLHVSTVGMLHLLSPSIGGCISDLFIPKAFALPCHRSPKGPVGMGILDLTSAERSGDNQPTNLPSQYNHNLLVG